MGFLFTDMDVVMSDMVHISKKNRFISVNRKKHISKKKGVISVKVQFTDMSYFGKSLNSFK